MIISAKPIYSIGLDIILGFFLDKQPLDEVRDIYYNSGKVNEEGDDIRIKSNYVAFKINGKTGLLDKNGKVVLKAKFDDIAALSYDLFSCTVGEYRIIMNAKGQEIQ